MKKIEKLEEAIAFFNKHGISGIDSYPYEPKDPDYDSTEWGIECCAGVTRAMLPVYVACLFGYSTPLVAKAMLNAEINITQIAKYVEISGIEPHILDENRKMDAIDFSKQILQAYAYTHCEQGWFKDDLMKVLTNNHSLFSLAVMHLGVPGVDVAEVIKRERAYLKNYQPDNSRFEKPDFECRAHHLRDVLYNIGHDRHLPNNSPADFIRQMGALDPFVTRKSFASGFWESLIYFDTKTKDSEVFQHILEALVADFPVEASRILKSLDFESTDTEPDIESVATTFEILEANMEANGLADVITDISYQIGTITSQINEAVDITFQSPEGLIYGLLGTEVFADRFVAMRDLGPKLYEKVMASHMKIPEDQISLSHLQVWSTLARFNPVPQVVSARKTGLYLAHLVAGMKSLLPEGYQHVPHYNAWVNNAVGGSIGSLISKLSGKIDYAPLRALDEDSKELLSQWGLSLRDLGVKSAKTIEARMGSDLGL